MMEIISFFYVLFLTYKVASGGESCQFKNGNWTYCENDCCGSWDDKRCCTFNTTALILCIIAVTMILAVVTFIVIYCHQAKKRKKPQVRPLPTAKPTELITTKSLDTNDNSKSMSSITYVVVPPGEPLYRVQDYPPPPMPPQPPPYADLESGVVSISETGYTYLHPMNTTLSAPPSYSGEQNTDNTGVERKKKRKKKRKYKKPKHQN